MVPLGKKKRPNREKVKTTEEENVSLSTETLSDPNAKAEKLKRVKKSTAASGIQNSVDEGGNDNGDDRHELEADSSDKLSSESSEDDSAEQEDCEKEVINVDFDFLNPQTDDFHGVKCLLNSYLDDTEWGLSEFVDHILSQIGQCTIIKVVDDETPVGLLTCLNLERYKASQCIKDVLSFLGSKASQGPEVASKMSSLIAGSLNGVGLIVSERLVNIPFDLAGPLYNIFFDEIKRGKEEETEELRGYLKYKWYLILTRVYIEVPKKKGNKKTKTKVDNGASNSREDFIFIRPEDELFLEFCTWSFTFNVQSTSQATHHAHGLRQMRLVMLLSSSKVPLFRARLKRLIEEGL